MAFRFIAHVPLPGVNLQRLATLFESNALLGMLDLFSGGAMRQFSVASMGVYPYITASIIMMLLVPVIPHLQALSQEGESGRNKINLYYPLADRTAGRPFRLRPAGTSTAPRAVTHVVRHRCPCLRSPSSFH